MSDLFSSAWSYLSGGGDGGSGGGRFVGQEVDMGGGKVVRIKRVIAEGWWNQSIEPAIVDLRWWRVLGRNTSQFGALSANKGSRVASSGMAGSSHQTRWLFIPASVYPQCETLYATDCESSAVFIIIIVKSL